MRPGIGGTKIDLKQLIKRKRKKGPVGLVQGRENGLIRVRDPMALLAAWDA